MISSSFRFHLPVHFTPSKLLGVGRTGVVVGATDSRTGKEVAIKRIHDPFGCLRGAKRLVREIELLRAVNHSNVLHLAEIILPDIRNPTKVEEVYIVTDVMGLDLEQVLQTHRLSPEHQRYLAYQLVCAVQYLHASGIAHRDLKPANLLLNSKCELKVCDFGMARHVPPSAPPTAPPRPAGSPPRCLSPQAAKEEEMTSYVTTRPYRAPEVMLARRDYGTAVDMWAVGCIFAELLLSDPSASPPPSPSPSASPSSPTSSAQQQRRQRRQRRHQAATSCCQGPLFPGGDYLHTLRLICELCGVPSEAEARSFVRSPLALAFLADLRHRHRAAAAADTDTDGNSSGSGDEGEAERARRFAHRFLDASPQALQLLRRLLAVNPRERITAEAAMRHPYFASLFSEADVTPQPTPAAAPRCSLLGSCLDKDEGSGGCDGGSEASTPCSPAAPSPPAAATAGPRATAAAAAAAAESAAAADGAELDAIRRHIYSMALSDYQQSL